jgi:hypothetical protein
MVNSTRATLDTQRYCCVLVHRRQRGERAMLQLLGGHGLKECAAVVYTCVQCDL